MTHLVCRPLSPPHSLHVTFAASCSPQDGSEGSGRPHTDPPRLAADAQQKWDLQRLMPAEQRRAPSTIVRAVPSHHTRDCRIPWQRSRSCRNILPWGHHPVKPWSGLHGKDDEDGCKDSDHPGGRCKQQHGLQPVLLLWSGPEKGHGWVTIRGMRVWVKACCVTGSLKHVKPLPSILTACIMQRVAYSRIHGRPAAERWRLLVDAYCSCSLALFRSSAFLLAWVA